MSGRWTLAGKKLSLIKTKPCRLDQCSEGHKRERCLKARRMTTGKKEADLQFGSGALEYWPVGEYERLTVQERKRSENLCYNKTQIKTVSDLKPLQRKIFMFLSCGCLSCVSLGPCVSPFLKWMRYFNFERNKQNTCNIHADLKYTVRHRRTLSGTEKIKYKSVSFLLLQIRKNMTKDDYGISRIGLQGTEQTVFSVAAPRALQNNMATFPSVFIN